MSRSTNLQLPYMEAAQAQKHITHNAALEVLDAIVQLSVESFDSTTPPVSATEGAVWVIGPGAVNDWAGEDGNLALWSNGGWLFITPRVGWRAALGTDLRVFDGAAWVAPPLPDLQNLAGVGINTSYDGTNKLAVSAAATLLSHDGAGHQLKINKNAPADTASLLFQTGWSGRAEMGTLGNDSFGIKVSADGAAWTTALSLNGTAATLNVPLQGTAVQASALDTTSGRVTRVGGFGLGATDSASVSLTTGDANLPSGFYAGSGATANTATFPSVAAASRPFLNMTRRIADNSYSQTRLFFSNTGAWLRSRDDLGSAWGQSVLMYSQRNVLGTVSVSAGVPTNALIERGTNANGEYVRFTDGTQICKRDIQINVAITNSQSFSFAAMFADDPAVTVCHKATNPNSALHLANIRSMNPTASNFQMRLVTAGTPIPGATEEEQYTILAVGRWF